MSNISTLMRKIQRNMTGANRGVQEVAAKRRSRAAKRSRSAKSRSRALPKPALVHIASNYINPVTGKRPAGNLYMVTNRNSGNKNYLSLSDIQRLMKTNINNYGILMANPKRRIFKHPVRKTAVYPRNLVRVRAI